MVRLPWDERTNISIEPMVMFNLTYVRNGFIDCYRNRKTNSLIECKASDMSWMQSMITEMTSDVGVLTTCLVVNLKMGDVERRDTQGHQIHKSQNDQLLRKPIISPMSTVKSDVNVPRNGMMIYTISCTTEICAEFRQQLIRILARYWRYMMIMKIITIIDNDDSYIW